MIRFESKSGSGVSMLEQNAKQLLELMKHSGDVPSAILADDIGTYLENLQSSIRHEDSQREPVGSSASTESADTDRGDEALVSLSARAYPLIELLKEAQSKKESIMWSYDKSII